MKIRLGFVSNSSSTSYIVAVTRDFSPVPEKIQEFFDTCNKYSSSEDVTNLEQAAEKIKVIIEALCKESQIWLDYECPCYHIEDFVSVFREEVQIFTMPSSSDDGKVCNILADSCKEDTMKKLTELMKA